MLLDDNVAEVRTREAMCSIAKTYFENLFAVKNGMYDPVLNLIQPTISIEGNAKLVAPIIRHSIKSFGECVLMTCFRLLRIGWRGFFS